MEKDISKKQFGFTLNFDNAEILLNNENVNICNRYFEDLSNKRTAFAIGLYSLDSYGFLYLETDNLEELITSFSKPVNFPEIETTRLFQLFQESIQLNKSLDQVFFCQGYKNKLANKERIATFMQVKNGKEAQYRFEHQNVWDSILGGIERVRIQNYSIFMKKRNLYSFFEVENLNYAMNSLSADIDNQRWQMHMTPMMDVGSGSRNGSSVYMKECFFVNS